MIGVEEKIKPMQVAYIRYIAHLHIQIHFQRNLLYKNVTVHGYFHCIQF